MRKLELIISFCNFRQERQKLVKSPPPLKDALTFLAETIVHVAVELPIVFFERVTPVKKPCFIALICCAADVCGIFCLGVIWH